MAKRPTRQAAQPARATRAQASMRRESRPTDRPRESTRSGSSSRSSGSTAPPFLTADDLKDGPNPFVIGDALSLYQRNDGTTVVFITVVRPGARNQNDEVFTWGLNCKSPDRSALQEQIGRNMLSWPGKKIALVPAQGSRGGWFVNLDRPDRPSDDDIPF